MREHPILMSDALVRGILRGQKTQTRRTLALPVHGPSDGRKRRVWTSAEEIAAALPYTGRDPHQRAPCPWGKPGDKLWVRECSANLALPGYPAVWVYRADGADPLPPGVRWTPSIHAPREASRLTLDVVSVRVERVQDISDADAIAEGAHELWLQEGEPGAWWTLDESAGPALHGRTPREAFRKLWCALYGAASWEASPWVWVIGFRRAGGGT